LEEPNISTLPERTRGKKKRCMYDSNKQERINYYEEEIKDRSNEKIRPDNIVRFSTAASMRDNDIKHPAPFHKDLPLYYINLLTDEGDLVIDPFSGIGTTGIACKELNREYIGYELNKTYADFSKKRIEKWNS